VRIEEAQIRHLAALAKLEVRDEELPGLQRDLGAILGYFASLQKVDTSDVPPTSHVSELPTPLRSDDAERVLPVAEAVRNAPRSAGGALVVPRVVE
jgi:aspartyl-tRNA(Asn)/glutamyl-tRNA(Gln) amidotransferase subunit C